MPISYDPKKLNITADHYSLQIQTDRPFLLLSDGASSNMAELFPFSSVHSMRGLDDTAWLGEWEIIQNGDEVFLQCNAKSSIWESKRYWFRCTPSSIHYGMDVKGQGRLTEVDYFGGYSSASLRWGSGYFESGNAFAEGFNPEPNRRESIYFPPYSSERIDLTGVPIPGRDGWFFTPPPFCFCFKTCSGWLAMGVEAPPGENRFGDYRYHAGEGSFHFSLSYDSMTSVNGAYSLPEMAIYFADDPYAAMQEHADALRVRKYAGVPSLDERPSWWQSPLFCGWGAQCNLASKRAGKAPDFATQENYELFLAELDKHGIDPGTVVIDDKWQLNYGENSVDLQKWPDLGGFIRKQHDRGRRVLLWLKFWDPEGVLVEECITNANGGVVSTDPTNPEFIKRFQESIRGLLSPEGLDADGFKVDFSARIPSGPGMHIHEDVWGLELMKAMLELLYRSTKEVKKEALVITHTPHPYLAPYLDMIRLNDINKGKDLVKAMTHRKKVTRIACPQALIDTDNWPITNKEDWLAYLEVQPDLGVPALYYSSEIDATHELLTPGDYSRLRNQWKRYSGKRSSDDNPSRKN